jgi:hypothetical protein
MSAQTAEVGRRGATYVARKLPPLFQSGFGSAGASSVTNRIELRISLALVIGIEGDGDQVNTIIPIGKPRCRSQHDRFCFGEGTSLRLITRQPRFLKMLPNAERV